MTLPTIAAIVTTRDRPRLLADALASIAAQELPPLEVRIADDGELPVFEALEASGLLEVTVLSAGLRGAAAARNLAARDARAEVLAFLDDDDLWRPAHLAGLSHAFLDPAVAFAFRDVAVVRERLEEDGRRIEVERRTIAHDWDDAMMRRDDYLPPSTWAMCRSLFERLGGFDEAFRYSEDWDFLLRAAAISRPQRKAGVTAEVRLRETGNASADRGPERRACLDRLAARHGLAPLVIKTFWDVAGDVEGTARSKDSGPGNEADARSKDAGRGDAADAGSTSAGDPRARPETG